MSAVGAALGVRLSRARRGGVTAALLTLALALAGCCSAPAATTLRETAFVATLGATAGTEPGAPALVTGTAVLDDGSRVRLLEVPAAAWQPGRRAYVSGDLVGAGVVRVRSLRAPSETRP